MTMSARVLLEHSEAVVLAQKYAEAHWMQHHLKLDVITCILRRSQRPASRTWYSTSKNHAGKSTSSQGKGTNSAGRGIPEASRHVIPGHTLGCQHPRCLSTSLQGLKSACATLMLHSCLFTLQPLWLCRTVDDYMISSQIIWPWSTDYA